jgi:acetate kinase
VIILVVNSGSSSLKYTLFDMENERVLFSGEVERIGLADSRHQFVDADGRKQSKTLEVADQGAALDEALSALTNEGPLSSLNEIGAVAHRVAHGGSYGAAARIDEEVMSEIRRMTPFIPLHHPAMIQGIEDCRRRMPDATHTAVFDTSFHSTIPLKAAIYGLPYRYYAEKGYRRTGFHGSSHHYVALKAAEYLERPLEELRVITCHLGSGASLCAIDHGKSIDTTLGMTALAGLIMGTRCGDTDPGLIPVIMKEDGLGPDEMIDMLYRDSGLKGISGVSRDMRDVEAAAADGNERAQLAIDAFCWQIRRSVGAMLMGLGGCDALVFTAGIGANSPLTRAKSLEGAEGLGFVIDPVSNEKARPTAENPLADISSDESRVKILAIDTNEELMMARQCHEMLR